MPLVFLLALLLLVLALPRRGTRLQFLLAMVVSFFAVVLPLFVFFVSAVLTPDSKSASSHGWIDCFNTGKLTLSPIVLWATAALYAIEVVRVQNRLRVWIVLGLFLGAIVSSLCLVFGLIYDGSELWMFLLVPLYIAVWQALRAAQLIKAARIQPLTYYLAVVGSLPFWVGGILWSRRIYESLPEQSKDCFVVTAATRGHPSVVGPFCEIPHAGRLRRANRQLQTFWQFETRWRARAPRSHARFRRFYNRLGPVLARRIASPWLSDLVYVALKPAELLASLALRSSHLHHPRN